MMTEAIFASSDNTIGRAAVGEVVALRGRVSGPHAGTAALAQGETVRWS